jgi:hypothetical protein
MNLVSTSIVGLAQFMFQLVIAMYLVRMLAIKAHNTAPGQALGALFF